MKWRDDNKAQMLIAELNELTDVNEKGEVTLGHLGTDFEMATVTLSSLALFDERVPARNRLYISRRAVIESRKAGKLDSRSLLNRLTTGQTAYLRQKPRSWVLLTPISVSYWEGLSRIRLQDATITFSPSYPPSASFQFPTNLQRAMSRVSEDYRGFASVRVRVSARDVPEAADTAFDRLNLVRAIWNLALNYRSFRVSFGGPRRPVNHIVLAGIQTLHPPAGGLAEDHYFQTYWREPPRVYNLRQHYQRVKSFESLVRKRLKTLSYGDDLSLMVTRYGDALDEEDESATIIKLWALLEELTARPRQEEIARRGSFLFEDSAVRSIILDAIRAERNLLVHKGASSVTERDIVASTLKEYAEVIIVYIMNNGWRFRNFGEVGELLAMSTDILELRRRMRLYNLALRIQGS